jgi:hypothetical protein
LIVPRAFLAQSALSCAAKGCIRRRSLIGGGSGQRAAGAYDALSPVKRGPKAAVAHPLVAEHAQLQRDYKRLETRLERTEAVIDIQKNGPRL